MGKIRSENGEKKGFSTASTAIPLVFTWLTPILESVIFHKHCHISMLKNPRTKRILSVSLLILGGLLIFLAPEDIWIGAVLFALGVGVELAGLVLGHRN